MRLLKCYTQYASKFEKLSGGHRTWKGQFSFQPQRRAVPQNVQTTVQFHSFHMVVRLCPKSFKLGFGSMWTENFQMFKLDLEKAEEPEIKLPTSIGSLRKQESSKKNLVLLHCLCWRLCVDHNKLWKILSDETTRPLYLPPEKSVCRSRSNR